MTVDPNSIKAYHEDAERLNPQRQIVLETIKNATHPSSADIVRLTGISRTSVCGRLKELENDGLIRKGDKPKIDPFTKKTVNYYVVIE